MRPLALLITGATSAIGRLAATTRFATARAVTPAHLLPAPARRPSPTQSRDPTPGSGTSHGPAPSSRDQSRRPSASCRPGQCRRSRFSTDTRARSQTSIAVAAHHDPRPLQDVSAILATAALALHTTNSRGDTEHADDEAQVELLAA
jgi:hypothetical protein